MKIDGYKLLKVFAILVVLTPAGFFAGWLIENPSVLSDAWNWFLTH